jgi:hypothetical protein
MPAVDTASAPPAPPATTARYGVAAALAAVAAITVVRLAFLAAEFHPLHADEAQYWTWALDPAFGYYSKPPMLAWLIWATTGLAGDGEFGVRLSSPIMHAIAAMFLYGVGRRLFDERVGLWTAVTYATLPAVSLSAVIASTDAPLLMFWSAALYCFVRALDGRAMGWWLATGAALGLAMLSKYAAIAFPAGLLLYLAVSPGNRRLLATPGPWLALAVMALLVAPNLLWNAAHGWQTITHVGENAALGGSLFHPDEMLDFLGAQFGVFGPILFGALLIMLARGRRELRDDRMRLLLSFVVPMLAAITLQALLSRANANWAAPVYAAATVAVVAAMLRDRRRAWLVGSLALHLVAAAAIYGFEPARPLTGLGDERWSDPFRRLRGWEEVGREIAPILDAHPDALLLSDERRYLAHYIYEARVPLDRAYKWNHNSAIDDHYELISNMENAIGEDFIYLTRWDPGPISEHFESAVSLPDIRVRTHADTEIRLHVLHLQGFLGY